MKNTNPTNPLLSLAAEYNYLKEGSSERQIAHMLLKNICKVPVWTIEQAALCCHVSISTFRRFIKDIGYNSYTEFKMKITDVIENYDFLSPASLEASGLDFDAYVRQTASSMISDIQTLTLNLQSSEFMQATRLLHDSSHIYIHDLLKSNMKLALQANLALSGKAVTLSYNPQEQWQDAKAAGPSKLFLLVYDGQQRSRQVVHTIPEVHSHGGKMIVLSGVSSFPHMELCEIVIYTGAGHFALSDMLIHDLAYLYLAELYKSRYISGKKLIE